MAISTESTLEFHRITSSRDPLWLEWKAIYDVSFHASERMSDAWLESVLQRAAERETGAVSVYALVLPDEPGRVAGISLHEIAAEAAAGVLWYIAVRGDLRSRGLGPSIYQHVLNACEDKGAHLLLLEVEIPEVAAERSPEDAEWARRRIEWYRRQGARVLCGIHYVQTVDGGQPPVAMHLMAHTLSEITPEQVYQSAKRLFEDALTQTGPLSLA